MENGDKNKQNRNENDWDSLKAPAEKKTRGISADVVHSLGNKAAIIAEMARGKQYDMTERADFKDSEVEHYLRIATGRNLEFLQNAHADESLKTTYKQLMSDYPSLGNIILGQIHGGGKYGHIPDSKVQNAYHSSAEKVDNGAHQVIRFNFENPDIYLSDERNERGDLQGFYLVLTEIALRVGAKPEDVAKNRALVSTFILAHEFGHALDFQKNFLAPAMKQSGDSSSKSLAKPLAEALAKARDSRAADYAGMLDGAIDAGNGAGIGDIIRSRYKDLDLRTLDERRIYCKKSYRTSRSESYADSFATNFIMKHYDRFFYDPRKSEQPDDRVPTNLYGETRTVNSDFLPYLDFHAGKHVGMRILGADGKARDLDGYLGVSIRQGEPLYLNLNGDPADNSAGNIERLGKIMNVRMKQEKGQYGAINTFFLTTSNAETIKLSVPKNSEAPAINVDPSDFIKRYHVQKGSQLSLLKREVKDGRVSKINTCGLLSGRLKNIPGTNDLIELGDPIYLSGDKTNDTLGGNTSGVRRFYRKWKRYFVETSTSTYELLPYIPKKPDQH